MKKSLITSRILVLIVICGTAYSIAGQQSRIRSVTGIFKDSSRAEDWPGWRGPTRQGISSENGLPIEWSDTENVAWKTPIQGSGWSSPIVYKDRVFVTTATDEGVSCHVICIDRRSGKINWNVEVFRQEPGKKEGKSSYATPTPVTDGKRVYAVFSGGGIAALSLDGKVAWVNQDNKYHSVYGCGASPILHNDLLIFPYDITSTGPDERVGHTIPWDQSYILALDKDTGKVRWKTKRGLSRAAHVTPQVMKISGQEQLISGAGDTVQGFDLETGNIIWWSRNPGEGVVPSIVVAGNLIFTASGFGDPTIRALRAGGHNDITATHLAWQVKKAVPMIPSFVFAMGHLFTINESGIALCIRIDTGEIVWEESIGGKHFASPIFAEGKIYFLSEEGETTIIRADTPFEVIARNQLNEPCQASMAVSRGQLFIRTKENLYCIGKGRENSKDQPTRGSDSGIIKK